MEPPNSPGTTARRTCVPHSERGFLKRLRSPAATLLQPAIFVKLLACSLSLVAANQVNHTASVAPQGHASSDCNGEVEWLWHRPYLSSTERAQSTDGCTDKPNSSLAIFQKYVPEDNSRIFVQSLESCYCVWLACTNIVITTEYETNSMNTIKV